MNDTNERSVASDGSALALAIRFHEVYERLAPRFGYETRLETRNFDPQSQNGRLMVAVCREIIEQNTQDQRLATADETTPADGIASPLHPLVLTFGSQENDHEFRKCDCGRVCGVGD